jgi:dTDP-4-dehydrorhamnose reductase
MKPVVSHHPKRLLLFGAGGKLGTALRKAFDAGYLLFNVNSSDVEICDADQVRQCIARTAPDIVINAAAFVGLDPCEQNPHKAMAANTLFPKLLAELSVEHKFILTHISTDAVFNGDKHDFYTEEDCPRPLNVYGLSKYGGECFVAAMSDRGYLFRIPLLFGENRKNNQFVEKMFVRLRQGEPKLSIANDIVTSPSYSNDVAAAIKAAIETQIPFGLYHLANEGCASLYELVTELAKHIDAPSDIAGCSHASFPSLALKNRYTPLRSVRMQSLRPWRDALAAYCAEQKQEVMHE